MQILDISLTQDFVSFELEVGLHAVRLTDFTNLPAGSGTGDEWIVIQLCTVRRAGEIRLIQWSRDG